MSYESVVDQGKTDATVLGKGEKFSAISDVQEARLTGYGSLDQQSGIDRQDRTTTARNEVHVESHGHQRSATPASHYALSRALDAAEYHTRKMIKACAEENLIELSNEGFALQDTLAVLWELRSIRGDDWADLLNIVQGALQKEEFERFSADHCSAINEIVVNHLRPGAANDDDIERSIGLLRRVGLDPWKGISGEIHTG